MPFQTDGGVHETTDASTTSFVSQTEETAIYARRADGTTPETADGDTADEVNPRKLMKDPTIDDVRWLARTSFGSTIITKPVEDAFKHGYEITQENEEASRPQQIIDDHDWEDVYKQAQVKARRDGFSLVFGVLNDNASSAAADPLDENVDVDSLAKLQVLSLDDLVKFKDNNISPAAGRIGQALPDELQDNPDVEIRRTGIVVDMDPSSTTYKEPLGYLVGKDRARDPDDIDFIHRNRVFHHLVWNGWVDGNLEEDTLGEYEGDGVLVSSYHILRGVKKGNWSIMQTLFRYAAKLYHVELPEDADEEDWEEANDNLVNMNAKSEIITPHGYEVSDYQTDGQLEPQEYFDVLFDQVCASNEMTKSVLFGTQTGTVSGSETDIKNYFNQVERFRTQDIEEDMRSFVTHYAKVVDGRTSEEYQADFDVDWGPLFRLTALDRAETLTRTMQTLSAAVNDFVMTPQEARGILQEEWADANIDWEDDFSEEEEEFLKTLNVAQQGAAAVLEGEGEDMGGSTQQQNGGGREQGETSDPSSPATDRGLSSREMDRIADRVAERLQ